MLQSLKPIEISLNNIHHEDLHWVNQCYGKAPFQPLAEDIINAVDNKFQCSIKGPDFLPIFPVGTDSLLPIPSHFKAPFLLFTKGSFQDQSSIHLPGTNISGKKRKHFTSKRKSSFENSAFPITTLYCEETLHLKETNLSVCGVMIGNTLYNVDINEFDKMSTALKADEGILKEDFNAFVKCNSKGHTHPYVIDLGNYQNWNGIRIKVVKSNYFDSLPSTEKFYHGHWGCIHEGVERGSERKYPGYMVAFLHADPFMHPFELSWKLAEIFHKTGQQF